jgi:hypothetical protein
MILSNEYHQVILLIVIKDNVLDLNLKQAAKVNAFFSSL